MIIYPAIDIYNSDAVRLKKGKFDEVTVYGKPVEVANRWQSEGSKYLHVVDLNGAIQEGRNIVEIESIVKNTDLSIQCGGGIRSAEIAKTLLDLGVAKIILGTAAIKDKDLLVSLVNEYKERIIVGIDANSGKVAIEGWKEVSAMDSMTFIKELESIGVETIVYTDIAKDGMLEGPNFEVYEEIGKKSSIKVVASGGITVVEDLIKLKEIGVYGAIVGKALYEDRIDLKEAIDAC